jgi:hypothetical protein
MVSGKRMGAKTHTELYCPLLSFSASLRNYLLTWIPENYIGREASARVWGIIREAIQVHRNTEARSCNRCLCGEKNYYIFLVCVCSLSYPACNAHAPYFHLSSVRLYNIFPHYLINGTILEKKLLNTKWVFWFSLPLLSESFLILRRNERDMIKNVYRSACEVPVTLVRF